MTSQRWERWRPVNYSRRLVGCEHVQVASAAQRGAGMQGCAVGSWADASRLISTHVDVILPAFARSGVSYVVGETGPEREWQLAATQV